MERAEAPAAIVVILVTGGQSQPGERIAGNKNYAGCFCPTGNTTWKMAPSPGTPVA
jgi:hypothetical protein